MLVQKPQEPQLELMCFSLETKLNRNLTELLEWKILSNSQLIQQNESFLNTTGKDIYDIAFEFNGISNYPNMNFVGSVVNGKFFAMNICPSNPYGQNFMYYGAIEGTITGNTITIDNFKWDTSVNGSQRSLTGKVLYRKYDI